VDRAAPSSPFERVASPRALLALALAAVACGVAMLPAMATMGDHGHSVIAFESAGSVGRSREILGDWGEAGRSAMRWQLAIDTPFLLAYGLLLAGSCAAVLRRARERGQARLAAAAAAVAWFGAVAAAADFAQNVSLALVLGGHVAQPWPAISAVAAPTTSALALAAALLALGGYLATRRAPAVQAPGR
jgi:hypothetical protein